MGKINIPKYGKYLRKDGNFKFADFLLLMIDTSEEITKLVSGGKIELLRASPSFTYDCLANFTKLVTIKGEAGFGLGSDEKLLINVTTQIDQSQMGRKIEKADLSDITGISVLRSPDAPTLSLIDHEQSHKSPGDIIDGDSNIAAAFRLEWMIVLANEEHRSTCNLAMFAGLKGGKHEHLLCFLCCFVLLDVA